MSPAMATADISMLSGFYEPRITTVAKQTSAKSIETDEGWLGVLAKLEKYYRDPNLRADDLEPPSWPVFNEARRVAKLLREMFPLPSRVTIDGEGGIVFEFELQNDLFQVCVEKEGLLRILHFEGTMLITEEVV